MNDDTQPSRLDTAFAYFLSRRSPISKSKKKDLESLISKLSLHQSLGHNCIYLNQTEHSLVLASGLLAKPDNLLPLVIENNRLYLHRYWFYENRLAEQIKRLLATSVNDKSTPTPIKKYFSHSENSDWQKKAVNQAISQFFTIISGGPGTGKTTTIVKIIAILLELAETKGQTLHIALAAPTGKAAKRLQESISSSKKDLPCSDSIKHKIPTITTTIHRLLGANHTSPYFKHNSQHLLTFDVVIIDEASMIDLALMSKLVDSLKPGTKFILLGDKDQLTSVESGAVLGDLSAALPRQTVELKKSHRFTGEIKALADAVNGQFVEEAWNILNNDQKQVSLLEENLVNYAIKHYTTYLESVENNADFNTIFTLFNQFQILCATRYGENGVVETNSIIEERLIQKYKIRTSGQWYLGRPIMVTENNPETHLYNGDIGICLLDKEQENLTIFFPLPNGSTKKVLPNRLPEHETVFAMTIHKSQGSEFNECLCVLPNTMNPVLSKELIYTAITRAKTKLKIHCTYSIFSQTIENKINRTGGLFEKLTNKKFNLTQ